MNRKRRIWRIVGGLVVLSLVLVACGGGQTNTGNVETEGESGASGNANSDTEKPVGSSAEDAPPPTATLPPEEQFPDVLVIHPEAYDFEVTPATNTYVYLVPMMVQETVEYLEIELKNKGWTELGKPTIMGHLATLNLQQEGYRLTISMQDNEKSMSTRVQMLLMKQ